MANCGVGNMLGQADSAGQLRYQAGRHDAALELAAAAGFDQASIAVAILTDQLEGTLTDETYNHPDPPAYVPGSNDDVLTASAASRRGCAGDAGGGGPAMLVQAAEGPARLVTPPKPGTRRLRTSSTAPTPRCRTSRPSTTSPTAT